MCGVGHRPIRCSSVPEGAAMPKGLLVVAVVAAALSGRLLRATRRPIPPGREGGGMPLPPLLEP